VYLDNWDCVTVDSSTSSAPSSRSGELTELQAVLRELYSEWGVARSEKKAVVAGSTARTLGAAIRCREARALPSPEKYLKAYSLLFYGLRRGYWSELSLGALLGQACFLLQFKRSAMCVLNRVWTLCDTRYHRGCFEVYNNELLLLFAHAVAADRCQAGPLRHSHRL